MKKRVISAVLVWVMLISTILFPNMVFATTFSDVSDSHWAISYINSMQESGIINGYEDGTFKPENLVKHGEFIKMVVLCRWPVKPAKYLPEGTHWAQIYADYGNGFIIDKALYDNEKLEKPITRAEAVEMIWRMYIVINKNVEVDTSGKYIKEFKDEATITDEYSRYYFDYCIQHGLINGFEDGTLRPNETLTRAQATKLLSILIYK